MNAGRVLGFYQDVQEICYCDQSLLSITHCPCKKSVVHCRLAKRPHLFSGAICDEVVKLLTVYTFVKSASNGPPSFRRANSLRYALPPPILQYFAEAKMPLGER
jgi:hypothetical protein